MKGASYLEMDVVGTQDRRLVLRHDITLDDSTNIKQLVKDGRFKEKKSRTAYASAQFASLFCFVLQTAIHAPLQTLRCKRLRCD